MDVRKPYTAKAMKDHATTYAGFKRLLKWAMAGIAFTLVALAVLAL